MLCLNTFAFMVFAVFL